MRRLKYRVLFMGRRYPVMLALFAAPFAGLFSALCLDGKFGTRFLLITAAGAVIWFFLILLAFYLLYSRLRDEERSLIREAAPPHWRAVSEKLREALLHTENHNLAAALAAVFLLPGTVYGCFRLHRETGDTAAVLTLAGILCALPIGIFLTGILRQRFWKRAADRAEYAVLHVHRCFSRTRRARYGRKYQEHYAVCYLPDGRYVLPIDHANAQTVTVVRYHGHFRILTPRS